MTKYIKNTTLIIVLLMGIQNLVAQEQNELLILKNLSSGKEKIVAPNSKFKAKLVGKEKIKGRIASVENSFFVSDKNDTVYFSGIKWIKAKKKLTKREHGAGIAGLFAGTLYTPVSILGTTMSYFMERTQPGNPAIFLVNAIPIGVLVISVRTLAGHRYKMKNWELQTQPAKIKIDN